MRKMIACVILMAACTDPVEPVGPGPVRDAGGPMSGVWSVGWECKSGCEASTPEPVGVDVTVTVSGGTLTYIGGVRSPVVHSGGVPSGDCLDLPAFVEPNRRRNAYSLCLTDTGAEATIVWTYVGTPTAFTTWGMTATR